MIHDIAMIAIGALGGQVLAIGVFGLSARWRHRRRENAGLVQEGGQ